MPTDHDTVIADLKAEVQASCEARLGPGSSRQQPEGPMRKAP
jgi:hypothetical protein